MSYQAILFDLDGTLLNTLDDLHNSVNRTLAAFHLPLRTKEETRLAVGDGVGMLIARSIPHGQENPAFAEILAAFRADYAARLYGYERGLLYAYNYQMYYGTGLRGFLLLHYSHKEAPRLTATAKLGATRYLDRATIGSGAAMIDAPHREDIQLQVRYTF